jgi:hypothetical protein
MIYLPDEVSGTIYRVIKYLTDRTPIKREESNYESLLLGLYNHFYEVSTWEWMKGSSETIYKFEHHGVYLVCTPNLHHKIIIVATNNPIDLEEAEYKYRLDLIKLIIDQYNIDVQGYRTDSGTAIVLDNVPFHCYWYIINIMTRYPVPHQKPIRRPEPPKPKWVNIYYVPMVYKKTPFEWLYSYHMTLLELYVYNTWGKSFDQLRVYNIRERVSDLNDMFNKLCVNISCYDPTNAEVDQVISFFEDVRALEEIRQYCFPTHHRYTKFRIATPLIQYKSKVKLIISILMERAPHLYQWLLKHSKAFEKCNLIFLDIEKDKEEKKQRKHQNLCYKTSNKDINYSIANIYAESFSPIYTGDKDLDNILRDITAPSMNDVYDFYS